MEKRKGGRDEMKEGAREGQRGESKEKESLSSRDSFLNKEWYFFLCAFCATSHTSILSSPSTFSLESNRGLGASLNQKSLL